MRDYMMALPTAVQNLPEVLLDFPNLLPNFSAFLFLTKRRGPQDGLRDAGTLRCRVHPPHLHPHHPPEAG